MTLTLLVPNKHFHVQTDTNNEITSTVFPVHYEPGAGHTGWQTGQSKRVPSNLETSSIRKGKRDCHDTEENWMLTAFSRFSKNQWWDLSPEMPVCIRDNSWMGLDSIIGKMGAGSVRKRRGR